MARFCASCGTEVDDTAIFCPTCGQPIDQEAESAIPPAPAWPDPSESAPPRPDPAGAPTRPLEPAWGEPVNDPRSQAAWDEPAAPPPPPPAARSEPPEIRPVSERRYSTEPADEPEPPGAGSWPDAEPPASAEDVAPIESPSSATPPQAVAPPPPPPAEGGPRSSPLDSVPVTSPVTLSGWLIGIGAALAAIGALIALFDGVRTVVDLLVLVAMAGVAISVFFSSALPAFGHLRLATLAIVLVALGAATDRILAGVGNAGELLLFMGAAAAVIGAVLLETGRDQPLGGS
jgi:zinc-ribbon domain